MAKARNNEPPRRRIAWFELGASACFGTVAILLLARVMWHILEHHELLPKALLSGLLFCSVAVIFAVQGLRPKRSRRRKLKGKISKRNRRVDLFLLLIVFSSSSRAQVIGSDAHSSPDQRYGVQSGQRGMMSRECLLPVRTRLTGGTRK